MYTDRNIFSPNKCVLISGIIEEEAVYVRWVNNGEPVTKFAAVESPENVAAAGLFESIKKAIASLKSTSSSETDDNYLQSVYK